VGAQVATPLEVSCSLEPKSFECCEGWRHRVKRTAPSLSSTLRARSSKRKIRTSGICTNGRFSLNATDASVVPPIDQVRLKVLTYQVPIKCASTQGRRASTLSTRSTLDPDRLTSGLADSGSCEEDQGRGSTREPPGFPCHRSANGRPALAVRSRRRPRARRKARRCGMRGISGQRIGDRRWFSRLGRPRWRTCPPL
jgi:hypothetical protein